MKAQTQRNRFSLIETVDKVYSLWEGYPIPLPTAPVSRLPAAGQGKNSMRVSGGLRERRVPEMPLKAYACPRIF